MTRIPYGIQCLKQLTILDISENNLEALPKSLERMHLHRLNFSGNPLIRSRTHTRFLVTKKFPSLVLLAAQVVNRFR